MAYQANANARAYAHVSLTLKPELAATVCEAVSTLYGHAYLDQLTARDRNTYLRILIKAAAEAVLESFDGRTLPLRLARCIEKPNGDLECSSGKFSAPEPITRRVEREMRGMNLAQRRKLAASLATAAAIAQRLSEPTEHFATHFRRN